MAATQKMNFLTLVSYSLLQTLFRTVSPQYKTSQTDRRQTDDRRHIVPKARPRVRSAKNGTIPYPSKNPPKWFAMCLQWIYGNPNYDT